MVIVVALSMHLFTNESRQFVVQHRAVHSTFVSKIQLSDPNLLWTRARLEKELGVFYCRGTSE